MRSPEEETPAAVSTEAEPPRPTYPGGKAALRRLQLLESVGRTRAAASVADAAAPAGDLESLLAVASEYSAAPAPSAIAAAAVETAGPTETDTDIARNISRPEPPRSRRLSSRHVFGLDSVEVEVKKWKTRTI
jgi:hypothetical protein